MWDNFFQPSIVINEEAFIAHYNKCIAAIFNRVLANVAASGLSPEDFLDIHSKTIVAEVQALKDTFMMMLFFPDEAYTNEFGIKLSRISLNRLHTFTHHGIRKGGIAGYN